MTELLSHPVRFSPYPGDKVWSIVCVGPSSGGERAPCVLGGGAEVERGPPHQPCPGPALLVLGPVGQSLYCPHTGESWLLLTGMRTQ